MDDKTNNEKTTPTGSGAARAPILPSPAEAQGIEPGDPGIDPGDTGIEPDDGGISG